MSAAASKFIVAPFIPTQQANVARLPENMKQLSTYCIELFRNLFADVCLAGPCFLSHLFEKRRADSSFNASSPGKVDTKIDSDPLS